MSNILTRIQNGDLLLADGAMGTELMNHGLSSGTCPESYNHSHPDLIRSIYQNYYLAGSDIVETNTFGGNQARLAQHGFGDQVELFNRSAAELAHSVCPKGKFVAGSIGPTGEMLQPIGDFSAVTTYDYFKAQALALAEGGVDIIFVETMMAIEEAEIAVQAVVEHTGLPVSASMTFAQTPGGIFTSFGVDFQTMAKRLEKAGANVIGINCGEGVHIVVEAIRELSKITKLPLIAQPNAGIPTVQEGKLVYSESTKMMTSALKEILKPPLGIIGGCCGTGPDYIRKMREAIDS